MDIMQTLILKKCLFGGLHSLTVGGHSHRDALLEATFLALVSGHFVNDTFSLVLTGVGRVEIFLDGPPEETLRINVTPTQKCYRTNKSSSH